MEPSTSTTTTTNNDDVAQLPHYTQFAIQPIEFIRANRNIIDFCQANVIKYVCRFRMKDGLRDLEKAKVYLQYLIDDYKKDNPAE